MTNKVDNPGVHLNHCFEGEYEGSCKYGLDDMDCPAYRETIQTVFDKQYAIEKIVLHYMGDDMDLLEKWFHTPNPMLGDVCPKEMFFDKKRIDRLYKFVVQQTKENGE